MAMSEHLLRTVAQDMALPRSAVRVLFVVHEELIEGEWRPVKVFWVVQRSGLSKPTAIAALRLLCERGYLERSETERQHHYRLGKGAP